MFAIKAVLIECNRVYNASKFSSKSSSHQIFANGLWLDLLTRIFEVAQNDMKYDAKRIKPTLIYPVYNKLALQLILRLEVPITQEIMTRFKGYACKLLYNVALRNNLVNSNVSIPDWKNQFVMNDYDHRECKVCYG